MVFSAFNNIKIAGISVAIPTQILEVETFSEIFGEENVKKFSDMTGVKSVCRAIPEQTASDLGFEAAADLLQKTGINKEEIGQLIFVTQKPDYRVPSSAFVLHKRLGLNQDCSCFDLNLACSGYIYALHTGMSMLGNTDKKYALVLTGDTSVRTLSPQDRTMIMLFGDSGTATLIERNELAQPVYFAFRTDGQRFKSIITPAGAYRNQSAPKERAPWGDGIIRSDYDTHMKGMDVFGFSITDVPNLIREFMEKLQTTSASYDYFTLHQANLYILKQISRKLKIPFEKIPITLDRYGNNSSNSVPMVLADHFGEKENGIIRTLLCAFGAGLSWACCDATLDVSKILPPVFSDDFYQGGIID
jgi:3-oxoacyl-[acyl-carrier-protein] synthase-3